MGEYEFIEESNLQLIHSIDTTDYVRVIKNGISYIILVKTLVDDKISNITTGFLKKDGSISMNSGYVPSQPLSISTKWYTDLTATNAATGALNSSKLYTDSLISNLTNLINGKTVKFIEYKSNSSINLIGNVASDLTGANTGLVNNTLGYEVSLDGVVTLESGKYEAIIEIEISSASAGTIGIYFDNSTTVIDGINTIPEVINYGNITYPISAAPIKYTLNLIVYLQNSETYLKLFPFTDITIPKIKIILKSIL